MEEFKKAGCIIVIGSLILLIGFFLFFIYAMGDDYDLTDNQVKSIVSNEDFLMIEKYLIQNPIKSITYSKIDENVWTVNDEKFLFDRDTLIIDSNINVDSLKVVLKHIEKYKFIRVDVDSIKLDFRLRNSSPISQGFGILTMKPNGKMNLDNNEFVEYTKIDAVHYKYREFVE